MGNKKVIQRYGHLRVLITRAKEDADRWGTNRELLLLRGIKETSSHDFWIYDGAYEKFLKKRKSLMNEQRRNEAEQEERYKSKQGSDCIGTQLARIADALEQLVQILHDERDDLNK